MPAIKQPKSQLPSARKRAGVDSAFATHAGLLADMKAYRKEVSASPDTAMAFLKRAGLVTASGKPKQLIRD